ncbi:EAL domain-containing protein [Roseiarcaceae bacterium H3SJ34-1]|uniref:putative bifunctional diguanylate cyclase/phosphodiesterase n=1 Tax=Terripilifer ovatus TaxID=3032367 RepID=UPI003AB94E50|nr:EAL domain-containing protein [Roseiarcaceae bacterium H3SJ34-1]
MNIQRLAKGLDASRNVAALGPSMVQAMLAALDEIASVAWANADGFLIAANERFAELSPHEPAELIGQHLRSIQSVEPPSATALSISSALAAGLTWRGDMEVVAKDGTHHWIEKTIVPVHDKDRHVVGFISIGIDVTERKRALDDLRVTREFLDTIVEHIPAIIFVKDAIDLSYVLINEAAERYYGKPRDQMIGRNAAEVFEKVHAERITNADRRVLETRAGLVMGEHEIRTPDGSPRIVATRRLPIVDDAGRPRYILGVINDVTERRQAEDRIVYLAYHDSLTGLGNRAAFNDYIESTIATSASLGKSFAVLYIDLDRFKEINDAYGHAAGDALLRDVSERLKEATGDAFVARMGGDEFAIVSQAHVDVETLTALCDRIHRVMEADFEFEGILLDLRLSIGVSVYPADGADLQTLLSHADAALYTAKADKSGVTRFFEPAMDTRFRKRHVLQQELRLAIARNEFVLHYQPIAKIDGSIVGFEALVRWHHPERGIVQPSEFIPLAEETGLVAPIGEWVLREACREAASWDKPLQIAVNASAVQLKHGNFAALVESVVQRSGLSARRLEIEITEGVLLTDSAVALRNLHQLKEIGVNIAMDDFGTGYSSLSYLQSFPFDKIKIDRSFVANLPGNAQSAAIVRAVIGLGHGLNLPIIAEGVETHKQLAFLAREGCDEIQGYLIGRPEAIESYRMLTGKSQKRKSKAKRNSTQAA